MKRKDFQEIKNKRIENLGQLLAEKEKMQVVTKFEQKLGKGKNVHSAGQLRRDIAKIKTILAEKLFEEKTKIKKGVESATS